MLRDGTALCMYGNHRLWCCLLLLTLSTITFDNRTLSNFEWRCGIAKSSGEACNKLDHEQCR